MKIETELYLIPLRQPMADAVHGVQSDFSLVVVKITTNEGATGFGYTYSVGRVGGTSIAKLIEDNIVPLLLGEDPRLPLGNAYPRGSRWASRRFQTFAGEQDSEISARRNRLC